jgi:hypothetical protein
MDKHIVILLLLFVLFLSGIIFFRYKRNYEGFQIEPARAVVTDSASDISGAGPTDISGCAGIPLSDFNSELVLSYIAPDIQYAIMSYSIGSYNYLSTIQKAFKSGDPTAQMAISALLARYLALNGGSAATPGPGFTNTSPGNYVAQMKGAKELLAPSKVDTKSPVYKSFQAATTVALCKNFNKGWVSTADF